MAATQRAPFKVSIAALRKALVCRAFVTAADYVQSAEFFHHRQTSAGEALRAITWLVAPMVRTFVESRFSFVHISPATLVASGWNSNKHNRCWSSWCFGQSQIEQNEVEAMSVADPANFFLSCYCVSASLRGRMIFACNSDAITLLFGQLAQFYFSKLYNHWWTLVQLEREDARSRCLVLLFVDNFGH